MFLSFKTIIPFPFIFQEIHACFNFIPQISNLPCFSLLAVLSLSCNNLTDIPSLHGEGPNATHPIKELYLANNKITRLRGLEQYPYLQVLDLRSNKISLLENIGRKDQLKRFVVFWVVQINCMM